MIDNNLTSSSSSTVTLKGLVLQKPSELKLLEHTLATINLILIVFGTAGNSLTLSILFRKNVYKHSCMRYLAALCLLDTFCLYTWNLSMVYSMFRGRKIEHESPLMCRLFSFYSYFTLQASSWVICAIGMDRLATVILSSSNRVSKILRNTRYVTAAMVLLCLLLNLVVIFKNAEPVPDHLQRMWKRTYTCYEPRDFFFIWDIVHIVMYSLLPFAIILCENVVLTCLARKHANRMRHLRNLSTHMAASYPRSTINAAVANNTNNNMGKIMPGEIIATTTPNNNDETDDEITRTSFLERLSQRFDKSKRVYRKNLDIRTINKEENKRSIKKSVKKNAAKPTTTTTTGVAFVDKSLLLQAKRNKKLQSKGSHVTKLLMFLTVSFFFTTVPFSLFYALKLNIVLDSKVRVQVAGVLSLLQYLRHSGNFLIYLLTSSIIKFEIKSIFRAILKCFISPNNKL